MAKSTQQVDRPQAPPHPREAIAFENWLKSTPRDWQIAIAVRAALRVIPMVRGAKDPSDPILAAFRATALARFAILYLGGTIEEDAASSAATFARAAKLSDAASKAVVAAAESAARATRAAIPSPSARASVIAAASAAPDEATAAAILDAIRNDAQDLRDQTASEKELLARPLWAKLPPPRLGGAWEGLKPELHRLGEHWSVWIDWYEDVLHGVSRSEFEDAAFTDIRAHYPWTQNLQWDDGSPLVNTEIARRLDGLVGLAKGETQSAPAERQVRSVIARTRLRTPNLPNRESDRPRVTTNLDPDTMRAFETAARRGEQSKAELLRELIEDAVDLDGSAPLRQDIIGRKKQIVFLSNLLITAFEDALQFNPQRHHNQPPPALRIEDNDYLKNVRELVAELRHLNENLEAAAKEITKPRSKRTSPARKAIETSSLDLKKHLNTFLSRYAGALGTGAAALTIGTAGALLYQMGVPLDFLTKHLHR